MSPAPYMHSCPTAFRLLALLSLLAPLGACGDESMLDLDDRVDLQLFTEIEEVPDGPRSYTQRATVVLSPSLSERDVELITRVRIVDPFEQDWVLSDAADFEAGDRGWELVAERSANGGFRTGPWRLRMVVEERGVFVTGHPQSFGAVGAPAIAEASLTPEGEATLRWSLPRELHDWTLELVQETPSGQAVLDQISGQGRGGGAITARFDVSPAAFEPPNRLSYRLVMTNSVSRRTVEDELTPAA